MSNSSLARADALTTHPSPAASTPRLRIDKGIPIPPRASSGPRPEPRTPSGRTLVALEVNDSFVWPGKKGEDIEVTRNRAQAHFSHLKPKKFKTRVLVEDGAIVLRVWRIV